MAELRTHLATERVRVVALRLKQTRPSSIPTNDPPCRFLKTCNGLVVPTDKTCFMAPFITVGLPVHGLLRYTRT